LAIADMKRKPRFELGNRKRRQRHGFNLQTPAVDCNRKTPDRLIYSMTLCDQRIGLANGKFSSATGGALVFEFFQDCCTTK